MYATLKTVGHEHDHWDRLETTSERLLEAECPVRGVTLSPQTRDAWWLMRAACDTDPAVFLDWYLRPTAVLSGYWADDADLILRIAEYARRSHELWLLTEGESDGTSRLMDLVTADLSSQRRELAAYTGRRQPESVSRRWAWER